MTTNKSIKTLETYQFNPKLPYKLTHTQDDSIKFISENKEHQQIEDKKPWAPL